MLRKTVATLWEEEAAAPARLVAVRDRRTGRMRILSAAHMPAAASRLIVAEDGRDDVDLAFLAALGRG